ncbi:hypothetical protein [Celerinatantimonas sp. MCCC 1A17872]|uniref:hypothetical protein n=1 Tax=Celerinatantimonas sp. MCCC 1A17872 TaxID=3177514 RepID=UPI0038C360DE
MSRAVKRKIVIDNIEYCWVLDANSIDGFHPTHIRVHRIGTTSGILYIDPYNWHFEVTPKFIAQAISFALDSGWDPVKEKKKMYVSYLDESYKVLPQGIKFGYQLNNPSKDV